MAPAVDDIQVGDLVNVPGGMHGTIKYLGAVAGKPGRFAGIELAVEHAKRGKNSGDVDGRKYFTTSVPGSGIFVPMNNNKYVTRRSSGTPPTPVRAAAPVNFSKSVGPGTPSMPRPRMRQPSLPRPESPRTTQPPLPPPKLSLGGLRTPSASARQGPSPNGFPRSPLKAPSRLSDRAPSRMSSVADDDFPVSARTSDVQRNANSVEIQDLKDQVRSLETQLMERDRQLDEQASTLAEFQRTIEEFEGSDALSIRAQLREKNDKIAQLTAEFDSHRADFRSTLDTLEVAASETERVYEQRLDELMQQNKELQDRGEDVETVARQLKQLEELVSELEEGLEDARRGEAEARAEVEFLRGEVERTKLELKKERDSSAAALKDVEDSGVGHGYSRELDQKDDEIRGLKAIIHSLSRGDPSVAMLHPNGLATGGRPGAVDEHLDPDHVARLEQRLQEFEELADNKNYRIEELERELQQLQINEDSTTRSRSRNRSSTISPSTPKQHKPSGSSGNVKFPAVAHHAHRLSDRTIVPGDWHDLEGGPPQAFGAHHHRTTSEGSHHRLETMHESDSPSSDDGNSLWCEICETGGHDILNCTNMFGAGATTTAPAPAEATATNGHSEVVEKTSDSPSLDGKDTPNSSIPDETPTVYDSDEPAPLTTQKTGRDAVLEGLKSIGGLTSSMSPVAGKASGVIDETKWCALCERDGHESIDCPFED
ncbi:hypothetical protein ASPZODRAFT_67684 [Penicilliopsis zonata CBS 506.65]|uniref:CAP-Gly domain-containing protein n=1 Tax=Penicilliopsis zonata CBS 506.65 TaxID=1073090 RepID=A0A1L9SGN2_9EURO|nr:hypothetical protein ASPZODRAFT_67684 [Penicilliopsis zonata CBS 506.65]OJJ46247.1 hypothetical protein ASPZODRAFT_67684 [Penicilliopsis zonata CBS 506.65]